MQDAQKIPRWAVENDPSWEKLTDSNQSFYLKWTKKGTDIEAVCSPTSTYCDIVGDTRDGTGGLSDLLTSFTAWNKRDVLSGGDITKYLSSRYLNPGTYNSPDFDIIRGNLPKMRKF